VNPLLNDFRQGRGGAITYMRCAEQPVFEDSDRPLFWRFARREKNLSTVEASENQLVAFGCKGSVSSQEI
jgi:hypothetical protein